MKTIQENCKNSSEKEILFRNMGKKCTKSAKRVCKALKLMIAMMRKKSSINQ